MDHGHVGFGDFEPRREADFQREAVGAQDILPRNGDELGANINRDDRRTPVQDPILSGTSVFFVTALGVLQSLLIFEYRGPLEGRILAKIQTATASAIKNRRKRADGVAATSPSQTR